MGYIRIRRVFGWTRRSRKQKKGDIKFMSDKVNENNKVTIIGEVDSNFVFSHAVFGEGFYMVDVLVKRFNNFHDRIPLMISERLIDVQKDYTGEYIMVTGQIQSYNRYKKCQNWVDISVFVEEVSFVKGEVDEAKMNTILLDGYVCKQPIYRQTSSGKEITDLTIKVNRPYGESDRIPCFCKGRNARFASEFCVGEHVQILGCIQSREYVKKLTETEIEKRVIYKVSISELECVID